MNEYVKNLNRIEFVVTMACTGKCKHCSEGDHINCKGHIDTELAVKSIRQICEKYKIMEIFMATKKTEKKSEDTPKKKTTATKKTSDTATTATKKAAVKSASTKKTALTASSKKTSSSKKSVSKKKIEEDEELEVLDEEEAKKEEYIPDEVDIVRELPDRYNETKLVLMMRDPEWCFFYWDISDSDIAYHSLKDKRISVKIFHVFGYDITNGEIHKEI